jgi:hypothetical protein
MPTDPPPNAPGPNRPPLRKVSPILIPGDHQPPQPSRISTLIRKLFGKPTPKAQRKTMDNRGRNRPGPAKDPETDRAERDQGIMPDEGVHRVTTELLPGRLQPLNPEIIQQEVRFLRASGGPGEQVVTLGWQMDEPPEHVQLDHPSIQPFHARMTFQRGNWMIESLSEHHPVEVNGIEVPTAGGPYLLANGDQVQIGEASFRYLMP